MAKVPGETFDIEAERFLVQLQLALKLLTFEWEANLELLATKLQELCQNYLQHLEAAKAKGSENIEVENPDAAGAPTATTANEDTTKTSTFKKSAALIEAPDTAGEGSGNGEQIEAQKKTNDKQPNGQLSKQKDSTDEPENTRFQIYNENINEESCHLILSHPEFNKGKDNEAYKSWINENLIGVIDTALKGRPRKSNEEVETEDYGDYTFASRKDSGGDSTDARLYIRLENLTMAPLTVESVQDLMQTTLYHSIETQKKFEGLAEMELIPVPKTDFRDAWEREILAEWYRGAALLWSGDSIAEGEESKGSDKGAAGLGGLLGAVPLSSVAKSAAAITGVATNIVVQSDDETKKESIIEAKVEAKDEHGVETTVEAIVDVKISDIPDTAEGSIVEAKPSLDKIPAVKKEEKTPALKATIIESTEAIQKSEAALVDSTVALASTETALVESAAAIGKAEAILEESAEEAAEAVTEVLESKAQLVTSAMEVGKSKESLLKSAISLGKSKSSLFGTALKFGDKLGEAFGVDLIDDKLLEDGEAEEGKLTGWAKVKAELPCPFDYPPDSEYILKFTKSIEDCLPSLSSASSILSRSVETHSPPSTIPFDATSISGQFVLNKLLVATHRVVITYICSENAIRYITGVEADPKGESMLSTGLDGVETVLGFMGPNPAAMAAASVLKAGRSMAEQKKKDAAEGFQRTSTIVLRKLWFLTSEVYAFLWFTKLQPGGEYEFLSAFHKASWRLLRENRAKVYADEEKPKVTMDVSEDYRIYLQEQALLLEEYKQELEVHAKEMIEGLEKVV